ncbi:MAG: S-methyl-5'-thioadenosine phosphorylase [Methanomassiliicoccus sp.]|nr:S-methyl-5'-thioadenosine phosphorylase [Methanomassiliicoccus sp.]
MAPLIGIIGGTGVYDPKMFDIKDRVLMSTPYGAPSDAILVGELSGVEVAFLSRHGSGHTLPPHMVNYRANIWALKQLGVQRVISPCAVGSLKEDYKPGDLVIVDQFIDQTKGRRYTFYDGARTVHISLADPFCEEMNALFAREAKHLEIPHHVGGTYVCIEGPRFSTRAESRMYRQFADIIGMTVVPECQLAREMDMCYTSLATITDYDVWAEEPVDLPTVLRVMEENVEKVQRLMAAALPKIPVERTKCACSRTLKDAGF